MFQFQDFSFCLRRAFAFALFLVVSHPLTNFPHENQKVHIKPQITTSCKKLKLFTTNETIQTVKGNYQVHFNQKTHTPIHFEKEGMVHHKKKLTHKEINGNCNTHP